MPPRKMNKEKNKANGDGNGNGNFDRYIFFVKKKVRTPVEKTRVSLAEACAFSFSQKAVSSLQVPWASPA